MTNPTPPAMSEQADNNIECLRDGSLRPSELDALINAKENEEAWTSQPPSQPTAEARPKQVHFLKTWTQFFVAVRDGLKPFEARRDDRDYQVGDLLVLQEWKQEFTGEEERRDISYILRGTEHVAPGFCILGLATLRPSPVDVGEEIRNTLKTCGDAIGLLSLTLANEVRQNNSDLRRGANDRACRAVDAIERVEKLLVAPVATPGVSDGEMLNWLEKHAIRTVGQEGRVLFPRVCNPDSKLNLRAAIRVYMTTAAI